MDKPKEKKHFPACFVELPPQCEGRRAPFYLATEEYIADTLPEGSYFFTWQIGRTVVMGRNQVAHQEVNLDFCHREGIDIIRRRSGGGAIFADEGNIMTSLITEGGAVEALFAEYAEAVAAALRQLGAPATVAGRNDIVLSGEWRVESGERNGDKNGVACQEEKLSSLHSPLSTLHQESTLHQRKVCGNAFYHKQDRCIAHGTMLYDTNPQLMEGALHPDVTKLEQRGVKSVRSRVGVLKDYLPFDVATLRQELRHLLTDHTITLTDDDVREIERLEQRYYKEDFGEAWNGVSGEWRVESGERNGDKNGVACQEEKLSYLHSPLSTLHQESTLHQKLSRRIEGCGMVELHFQLEVDLIREVQLRGDFFELGDAETAFRTAFVGQAFTPESLREAIHKHHPERTIRGLNEADITSILIKP